MVKDDDKGRKPAWKKLADGADAGFLALARSVGTTVGWISREGSQSLVKVGRLFVRDKKRDLPRPASTAMVPPAVRRDPGEGRFEAPQADPVTMPADDLVTEPVDDPVTEPIEDMVDELLTEFPELLDLSSQDEGLPDVLYLADSPDGETGWDDDDLVEETAFREEPGVMLAVEGNNGPDVEVLISSIPIEDPVEQVRMRHAAKGFFFGAEVARRSAQRMLVAMGPSAEPVLITGVRTDSPRIVELSLDGLERLGSGQLVPCLDELLGAEDHRYRIVALRFAQRLQDEEARRFLLAGSKDPSVDVRRRVVSYLTWRESKWAQAALRRLCDDDDPDVRGAAASALEDVEPSADELEPERQEQPQPAKIGPPAPDSAEKPTPVKVEKPAPVKVEKPAPAKVEKPAPERTAVPAPEGAKKTAPEKAAVPAPEGAKKTGPAKTAKPAVAKPPAARSGPVKVRKPASDKPVRQKQETPPKPKLKPPAKPVAGGTTEKPAPGAGVEKQTRTKPARKAVREPEDGK